MQKKNGRSWMSLLIPNVAISNGMKVLIPLYLLSLGGTALEVGIAFAIFNALMMLASMVWGRAVDTYHNERFFIALSFAGSLIAFYIFFTFQSILWTYVAYGVYGIFSSAASPAMNVILMGRKKKPQLGSDLAHYNMFAIVGLLVAYVAGTGTNVFGNYGYLTILAIANVIGLLLALLLKIPSDGFAKKADVEDVHIRALSNKYYPHAHTEFLRRAYVKRQMIAENEKKKSLHVLLLSGALFNLGYYVFFTPYIPFLKDNGISSSVIFLISLIGVAGQAAIYISLLKTKKYTTAARDYVRAILYRTAGFATIAVSTIFSSLVFLLINIVSYIIYGLSFGMYNMSYWFQFYDDIRGKRAGYYVGVWITVASLTSILGSLIGGYLGAINYEATLMLGAVITVSAAIVILKK